MKEKARAIAGASTADLTDLRAYKPIMDGLIRRRAAVPLPRRRCSASTWLADAPRYPAETASARFAHAKVSKQPVEELARVLRALTTRNP